MPSQNISWKSYNVNPSVTTPQLSPSETESVSVANATTGELLDAMLKAGKLSFDHDNSDACLGSVSIYFSWSGPGGASEVNANAAEMIQLTCPGCAFKVSNMGLDEVLGDFAQHIINRDKFRIYPNIKEARHDPGVCSLSRSWADYYTSNGWFTCPADCGLKSRIWNHVSCGEGADVWTRFFVAHMLEVIKTEGFSNHFAATLIGRGV